AGPSTAPVIEARSSGRGALFSRLREPASPARSPRSHPTHPLEVDASIEGGSLSIRWTSARARFDARTIERLAARFQEALVSIVSDPGIASIHAVGPVGPAPAGASVPQSDRF